MPLPIYLDPIQTTQYVAQVAGSDGQTATCTGTVQVQTSPALSGAALAFFTLSFFA
jgi:hypothetical protein